MAMGCADTEIGTALMLQSKMRAACAQWELAVYGYLLLVVLESVIETTSYNSLKQTTCGWVCTCDDIV